MRKNTLYAQLLPLHMKYQHLHTRTADLDMAVVKKAAKGKTAVQITMEIPCAEATVYRAIHRVAYFLTEEEKLCQPQSFQNAKKRSPEILRFQDFLV